MLTALVGNQNVARILIFLFVNGKCYGTQLHRLLQVPLTPIQKALSRLEEGGIILSSFEGKTKLYRFNPSHGLMVELELLLKKAYTLLSAQEKKRYYVLKEEPLAVLEDRAQILLLFWNQLKQVTSLTFHAHTKSSEKQGWNRKGQGKVTVTKEGANCLIFTEKGSWQTAEEAEMTFSNVFRWTLDRTTGVISLEHLRYGIERPVFLFHLAPSGRQSLSSIDSHLCGGDSYFGQIHAEANYLRLNWRVIGPKKNQELDYYYS